MVYKSIRFVLVCSSMYLSGCATSWRLQVADQNPKHIKKVYVDGYELAVSQTDKFAYGLTGEKEESGYLRLYVFVKNLSDRAINFLPEKTEVTYCNEFGCERLETVPAHKYIQKIKTDQAWALAAMALSSGLNSYNAGTSTSTTNTSAYGSAYGSGGYATGSVYGTSTTTTYDGAAAEAVRQRDMLIIQNQAQQYNNINNAVESGLVKSVTLFSGQEIGGNIMVKHSPASSNCYEVIINIDGEDIKTYFKPDKMVSNRCDIFNSIVKANIYEGNNASNSGTSTSSQNIEHPNVTGSTIVEEKAGWTGAYIINDKGPFNSKKQFNSIDECKQWGISQADLYREKEYLYVYECRKGEELFRQRVW